ncbi:MAG: hypothetical protein Q8Q48_02635 [Candidatus Staskawiczbacteria bacterium]|nr:hypothetical protein [Candidatus Staskawiczbacteria bacterium]
MKKNYFKLANTTGLAFLVFFAICFVWYYINPAEQSLHTSLLRLTFIGYSGMNFASFILGAVQSYVWGYIIIGVLKLVGCPCASDSKA